MTLVPILVSAGIAILANLSPFAHHNNEVLKDLLTRLKHLPVSLKTVYGTMCKKCHIVHIGETGHRLADSISEYTCSIVPFKTIFLDFL